jgi:hypothetical protein
VSRLGVPEQMHLGGKWWAVVGDALATL